MKKTKVIGKAFLIAAISLGTSLFSQSRSNANDMLQVAKAAPAPGWDLQDLEGKSVRSTDFKGKVVILDFWAAWCPPCRAEIPGLVELQKTYRSQGLVIVGVSVDQADSDTVKSFVKKAGINYLVVRADAKVVDSYGGIEGLPTTFIIDRAGRIVKQHLGFVGQQTFETEIKSLLNP